MNVPSKEHPFKTVAEFQEFSQWFQQNNVMPFAFGIGISYLDSKNEPIAYKWLSVNVKENMGAAAALMQLAELNLAKTPYKRRQITGTVIDIVLEDYSQPFMNDGKYHSNIVALSAARQSKKLCTAVFYRDEEMLLNEPIQDIADAHFRLALISRLYYKPNTLCLDNIFSVLPKVIWADQPYSESDWNEREWMADANVMGTTPEKFPPFVWGAPVPKDVRIGNPFAVRLGAYLSPGTTVMYTGGVNYNAGTLGKTMVEGTIPQGVVVGENTDIGARAGIMGTLSGSGSKEKITIGKDCLLGANSQCGISLGDNCVVSTGVCFTSETPFDEIVDDTFRTVKAREFAGIPNLTFRRHSTTGALQVIHRGNKNVLNAQLHS